MAANKKGVCLCARACVCERVNDGAGVCEIGKLGGKWVVEEEGGPRPHLDSEQAGDRLGMGTHTTKGWRGEVH